MAGENVVQAFRQFVQRIQDSTVHIEDDGFYNFSMKKTPLMDKKTIYSIIIRKRQLIGNR